MIYFLDEKHRDWPARERLCRRLGFCMSRVCGRGADFRLWEALLRYLSRSPWRCGRLFSALAEYWNCKLYLLMLEKEAAKVRTPENREIIRHVLRQAGIDLIREMPEDWAELCGLSAQKLMHIGYHTEYRA